MLDDDDDALDDDLDWGEDEDESLDTSLEPSSSETPEESSSEPETSDTRPVEATGGGESVDEEDPEKLRQRIRSAEGRYDRFGESIDEMRQRLEEMEARSAGGDSKEDGQILPEGWSQLDWEEFVADSPVEAEVLQAQSRELSGVRQRLDEMEQARQQKESMEAFRRQVVSEHPDYDELITGERQQVLNFIQGQSNPLVRKAYQQVYQQGTAEEVCELVSQYKLSKGNGDDRRRIESSLAVPSRSAVPDASRSGGLPPEDDEDAAWEFFPDESID